MQGKGASSTGAPSWRNQEDSHSNGSKQTAFVLLGDEEKAVEDGGSASIPGGEGIAPTSDELTSSGQVRS